MESTHNSTSDIYTIKLSEKELHELIQVIRGNCKPEDYDNWDKLLTLAYVTC